MLPDLLDIFLLFPLFNLPLRQTDNPDLPLLRPSNIFQDGPFGLGVEFLREEMIEAVVEGESLRC